MEKVSPTKQVLSACGHQSLGKGDNPRYSWSILSPIMEVENYPKWKEPNIGDTPIFPLNHDGRKGTKQLVNLEPCTLLLLAPSCAIIPSHFPFGRFFMPCNFALMWQLGFFWFTLFPNIMEVDIGLLYFYICKYQHTDTHTYTNINIYKKYICELPTIRDTPIFIHFSLVVTWKHTEGREKIRVCNACPFLEGCYIHDPDGNEPFFLAMFKGDI